jgi:Flp pilus assembly protein TadD
VALGDLSAAQQHFQQAAEDPGLESIAYANLALVSFESGDDEAAIRAARQLLRRCRQPP